MKLAQGSLFSWLNKTCWNNLEQILREPGSGRPAKWHLQEIVRAIFYICKTGCQWRMLPVNCLLYTSPSPRDATLSRMPSSA